MRSYVLGLGLVGVAALALGAGGGGAAGQTVAQARDRAAFVPGQVIVRYRAGTTAAERLEVVRERRGTVADTLAVPRTELVDLPGGASVEDAVADFEADPDVAYAEPNLLYRTAAIPNDSLYPTLWAMPKIGAPAAWDSTTGSASVLVAVIDTGMAYDHPDLAPNVWTNPLDPVNGVDDDGNGKVDDVRGWDFVGNDNAPLDAEGHGTHVAGTIGARGNNTIGVTGVAWQVSLMPLRAGDASAAFSVSAVADAIAYACAHDARVVNGSFGGQFSSLVSDAVNAAACASTLFVFSAGNAGADNDVLGVAQYPCSDPSPRIVCVAASDQSDGRASFSNYGATTVDLAAPGVGVPSAYPTFSTVMSDGFGNSPTLFSTRWGATSSPAGHPVWGQENVSFVGSASGAPSLADSPAGNYAPATDTSIRSLLPLDLTGRGGCSLGYWLHLDTQAGHDFLEIGASTATGGPYTDLSGGSLTGSTGSSFALLREDLGRFDGAASVYLRFRLTSDADAVVGDGAHVEDVALRCAAAPPAAGEYKTDSGTSMAAPHVAGVAALMLARNPALTVAQLKARIIGTVDAAAAFANPGATPVVSGGRLNAQKAVAAALPPAAPMLTQKPSALAASTAAAFAFTGDPLATLECSLDAAPFATCASTTGQTYSGLGQGSHTFAVRAANLAGATAAGPWTWTVDTVAPAPPVLTSGPAGLVRSTSAAFALGGVEAGAALECALDAGPFAACASPHLLSGLGQGPHMLQAHARDEAGNVSAAATRTWTVDTIKPATTIVAAPARKTRSRVATFRFKAGEASSRFQCRLDRGGWKACRAPKTYRRLKKGSHTFLVRAIDAAGNVDATPAKKTWRIR